MSKDGGAIHPIGVNDEWQGMTLREYYAGQAMAGLLSLPNGPIRPDDLATRCFKYADAMIAEGERKG